MVSTFWQVSSLLFFYSRCPPVPSHFKNRGHVPPVPIWSRCHWVQTFCYNRFGYCFVLYFLLKSIQPVHFVSVSGKVIFVSHRGLVLNIQALHESEMFAIGY